MPKHHDSNNHGIPPDGGEYFNRLRFSRSPYLLQHAHNPVDWYEWGEPAFEKARNENLPVLLSIGYTTCHWCHVMAHESFEDNEVADLLNRHFVCIKVDREERPDIDDFYMTASQVMTGSGGWPLNIFMTPDKRPFMALTYLPKRGRSGMPGFMELLANLTVLWRQRPNMIDKNCSEVMKTLAALTRHKSKDNLELAGISLVALEQLSQLYDDEYGGFGNAPKFPMPIYLSWLIEQGSRGNSHASAMALNTLRKMRFGGIWDHLGGGLHRYSTDREWLAPHFEKMLYDQAMLALVTLEAFHTSHEEMFLHIAEDIFEFVEREMVSKEGAYCAALDADSEGEEGKFYVWDKYEIDKCLGPDSQLFCRFYDVTDSGNFAGHTILRIQEVLEKFCSREGLDQAETEQILERCRSSLRQLRERRIRPFRDGKILTAWNGLMIAALARGGAISGNPLYLERAERAVLFILKNMRSNDGRLLRSYLDGLSNIPAFLEDYTCLAFSLLEMFEATLDRSWLQEALRLADEMISLFFDQTDGMLNTIGNDAEQMPLRINSDHDGVMPSAVSLTAQVLARLAYACDRPDMLDHAKTVLKGSSSNIEKNPAAHLGTLRAMALLESEPVTITFSGAIGKNDLDVFLAVVWRHLACFRILKRELELNETFGVQVCGVNVCYPVISDPAELHSLLCSMKT